MSTAQTVRKSLKDFGYAFNSEGRLRQLNPATGEVTDKPFDFAVSDSQSTNQKNYEDLGETITDYVYELLDKHGLHRIYLPEGQPESKSTFIFSSKKELRDVDKLMVIIHGSGVVRAGQWARSLIINDCLDSGTILPYIKRAEERGYEIIVTNTNDNHRDGRSIEGSRNPEQHASTVWETIVQPANAKSIAVVAHSYGGHVAYMLSKKYKKDFEEKVFVVALTDSVGGSNARLDEIGTNFVSSSKPAGTPVGRDGMPLLSAGHPKHEMTS
jgi:pimeloyl-ACP methyl ester carboxylesterase